MFGLRSVDVTLARSEGSLAVAPGPVVAVYGLHLVESSPAIYVIHPVFVARVDQVVARPGDDHVVAFARVEFVATAPAFDCVVSTATVEVVVPSATVEVVVRSATLEVVLPVCPEERILAGGGGGDLRPGFV